MILNMGAGQLDLVSHSLIIRLLPSCFNDGINILCLLEFDDIKVSGSESLILICVCSYCFECRICLDLS